MGKSYYYYRYSQHPYSGEFLYYPTIRLEVIFFVSEII